MLIKNGFKEIIKRNNYDICPDYQARRFSLLSGHHKKNVLNTRLALKYQLDQALKGEWSYLLIVANRGNLLFEHLYDKDDRRLTIPDEKKRKVKLILVDSSFGTRNP